MGKLLHPPFWQTVISELWSVRRLPGMAMNPKEVTRFFEIACRALDDVIHDSDYDADVTRIAEAHGRFVGGSRGVNAGQIRQFLDDCIAYEAPLIRGSDFNEAQAVMILSRMYELANYLSNPEFSRDGFNDRIRKLHEVVCSEAKKPDEKPVIDKVGVTIDAVTGLALISVDVAKANLGDILGLASVGGGIACLWKAARPFLPKS